MKNQDNYSAQLTVMIGQIYVLYNVCIGRMSIPTNLNWK